jgi:tRNA-2-methylthio-N6-dimethylallyladenosine synthase
MNVHDSDKVASLLLHDGWARAGQREDADLLILNTCSIRDKAEHRLYSELGKLREWKGARSGRALGVAGCVAQQQGDSLLRRFSQLDFVYGTHNLRHVPEMAAAALRGIRAARTEETSSQERFDLPALHPELAGDMAGRAFVTVMEGCDMFCSFCIVPRTRGREISRVAEDIEAEVAALVDAGILEVTLLGQTVNAFGRHDRRRGGDEKSFADLLRALAEISGLERIRYASSHPIFFDDELIRAHGEVDKLCPHIHLPVQSGSDRILEVMRRRHTGDDYRRTIDRLRASRPDLILTTDLIVGFPGETDADFQDTLRLMRDIEFVDSFSFKYSPRPGTVAAELPDPPPPSVAQARLEELQELQRAFTLAYHRTRVGETVEILVEGQSKRGGNQLAGRDPFHRVVNLAVEPESAPAPGSLVSVKIVEATPHSLIGALPDAQSADTRLELPTADTDSGEQSEPTGLKPAPTIADELTRGMIIGG